MVAGPAPMTRRGITGEAVDGDGVQFPDTGSAIAPEARSLGRYELLSELGRGGMASVYLARARGPAGFQKLFAVKRIHPQLVEDRAFVEMFLDEARIASAVHHPNVAEVVELGQEGGEYFIAMEYL